MIEHRLKDRVESVVISEARRFDSDSLVDCSQATFEPRHTIADTRVLDELRESVARWRALALTIQVGNITNNGLSSDTYQMYQRYCGAWLPDGGGAPNRAVWTGPKRSSHARLQRDAVVCGVPALGAADSHHSAVIWRSDPNPLPLHGIR